MAGKLIKYASQLGPTGESSQSGSAIVKILVVLGILIVLILFAFAFYGSANEEAGESAKQPDPKTSYTETEADGKPSEPDIDKQENPNNSFWPGTSLGGVVIPPNTETGPTETEDEICSSGTSDDEQIEGCDEDVDTEVYLSISAGEQITCSIFDGSVYCWGWNWGGQLGDGTNDDSNVPVAVSTDGALAGKTVTAISSSGAHACAIADDQAYCWGSNWGGQLGDGTTDDSNVPVAVSTDGALAGKTVTSISTGYEHTCAMANDQAYCWGSNWGGQLGDGTTDDSNVPVAVSTDGALAGKTVTAIAAGGWDSTCAIADGEAYCWGSNGNGQLGDGTNDDSNVPVAVSTDGALAGKTVTATSSGDMHTCAVADGQAYCWGSNGNGQLGDGTNDDSNVPVAVSTDGALAGKTVTAISAGDSRTCAIADDQAYCWGSNWGGQLGDGTTDDSNVPVAVSTDGALAGKIVTAISTSPTGHHTCAIASGEAYCWGWGGDGALGNGSDIGNNPLPVPVGPLPSI